jgi:hypothetical protein
MRVSAGKSDVNIRVGPKTPNMMSDRNECAGCADCSIRYEAARAVEEQSNADVDKPRVFRRFDDA